MGSQMSQMQSRLESGGIAKTLHSRRHGKSERNSKEPSPPPTPPVQEGHEDTGLAVENSSGNRSEESWVPEGRRSAEVSGGASCVGR